MTKRPVLMLALILACCLAILWGFPPPLSWIVFSIGMVVTIGILYNLLRRDGGTKRLDDIPRGQRIRHSEDGGKISRSSEVFRHLVLDLAGELGSEQAAQRIVSAAALLGEADWCALHIQLPGSGGKSWKIFGAAEIHQRYPRLFQYLDQVSAGVREPIYIDDIARLAEEQQWPHVVDAVAGSVLAVQFSAHHGLIKSWLVCLHGRVRHFSPAAGQRLMGVAALAVIVFDNIRLLIGERTAKRVAVARSIELARSNADLEQFAYVASHDLREPLRMISSFLGIFEQEYSDRLDARGKRFIDAAMSASQHMQELIHDLLEYARQSAERDPAEHIAVRTAVDSALDVLAEEITSTQAVIEIGDLPMLRYRPTQLTQIFQNLVGNALKFRGAQPPRIGISAERTQAGWRLSVRDNGLGIEPQYHQRIFMMFQRLHGREHFDGTGIGLSLCKKIVEAHGGEIGVEVNPGGGSHFWFTVPDQNSERDTTPSGSQPCLV